MAFLFHQPSEVNEFIATHFGNNLTPEMFGRRDEFRQYHLTENGIELLRWLHKGKVTRFPEDINWLEFVDNTAVRCFGADYDLLRSGLPADIHPNLDAFYGPYR